VYSLCARKKAIFDLFYENQMKYLGWLIVIVKSMLHEQPYNDLPYNGIS